MRTRTIPRSARAVPGALLLAVLLAGCAAGPNPEVGASAEAGFWLGLMTIGGGGASGARR